MMFLTYIYISLNFIYRFWAAVGWNVKDLRLYVLRTKHLQMKVCSVTKYIKDLRFAAQTSPLYHVCYIADAEKIIGWALSHHLMQNSEAEPDSKLVLSCER